MTDHYFNSQPEAMGEYREITANLRGTEFRFLADAGVFSKRGIDFGSRLLIETVELPDKGEILDLGCGYGPIGVACAASAPECRITMVDINRRAVKLAQENARLNGVQDQVEVVAGDGLSGVRGRSFDLIVTNPPIRAGKKTVYRLFEEANSALNPEGELWVVIRKQQGGPSAREKLQSLFTQVETITKKKGFWVLRTKLSSGIDTRRSL